MVSAKKVQELMRKRKITRVPELSLGSKWAKKKGKIAGLGVFATIEMLFEWNETAPPDKRMNDNTIKMEILKEFPEKVAELGAEGRVGKATINEYRSRFNRGRFTQGRKPRRMSWRYNDEGEKVEGRFGARELTQKEIKEAIAKYEEFWKEQE
jgi:hypothetical protein